MRYLFLFSLFFCWKFIQAQTYEQIQQLEGHYGKVTFLVFHSYEDYLVSGDEHGQILVWELATGKILKRFLGHQNKITHLVFNSSAEKLLSAAYDGACIIWDFETGAILHKIKNSTIRPYANVKGNEPTFVLWNKDESSIIYGGYNRKIHQFDLDSLTTKNLFTTPEGGITCSDLSPTESLLVFGVNEKIYQYDVEQKRLVSQLKNTKVTNNFICELGFVPTQKNLVAAWIFGGQLQIWDTTTKQLVQTLQASEQKGSSQFAFSNNGKYLITGNQDYNALLWNIENWEQTQILSGHTAPVKTVAFSSNNKYISTGSDDKTIIIWKQVLPSVITLIPIEEHLPEGNTSLATEIDKQRPIEVQDVYNIQGDQIKISIADDEQEDGDILSLIFNDQLILDHYELKKHKKILVLPITQEENYLVVYAHNEGRIPPNTIAIQVESQNGQKKFTLRSNTNTSAALKIMLEE